MTMKPLEPEAERRALSKPLEMERRAEASDVRVVARRVG